MGDVTDSAPSNLDGKVIEGHEEGVAGTSDTAAEDVSPVAVQRKQSKVSGAGGEGGTKRGEGGEVKASTEEEQKPRLSKLKTIWRKLGLDGGTLAMMFKGSLPPTIAVAFYQSHAVATTFPALGYLVPIITVFAMCIMPRAKYFQTLMLNVVGTCVGAAISLLGIWSGVQARIYTSPPGSTKLYNSSQAVICAIWLFANIWFANVLRAKRPALQFPVILYSIFTNVAFTFGPLFVTMEFGEALIKELLTAFLTAFGIATAVHVVVFPVTSRTVVFMEMARYIGALSAALKAQTSFLRSLEKSDMFSEESEDGDQNLRDGGSKKKTEEKGRAQTKEAKVLKGAIASLAALHGKLHGDLAFGKREIGYGHLDQKDLDGIFKLLRGILIPLVGLSTITDIFERIAERRGWVQITNKSRFDSEEAWENDPDVKERLEEKRLWNEVMIQLHEPFQTAVEVMDEGLKHAGILLELIPKLKGMKNISKRNAATKEDLDVEAVGGAVKPGDEGFADHLQKKLTGFYGRRGEALRTWAREKGLSAEEFDQGISPTDDSASQNERQHMKDQQQLYLILFMEFLLYSTGIAILKLARFAEGKVEDGTMKTNKFIGPGVRRLRKWVTSIGSEDSAVDNTAPDSLEGGQHTVYMGAGFNSKKDPEHLPATTAWEKFGNGIRTIPHFLGSAESGFGFRVACATMTVGIVAFLEQTQQFFIEQRLVWAMIIIAIGMTVTAGESIFGLLTRIAGTALSMVLSIVIWYIVDEHAPGVIVFFWFFVFIEMYFLLKFPRFIPVWIICIVTQALIIGYELQVGILGIVAAQANGQPYYPIYELAPYRLACVAGGSVVAFIWTVFPYPLMDRSWLRRDLGSAIYLLANYYNIVHSTIDARMHGTEGDMTDKRSPGRQLEKVEHKILGKLLLLMPVLRQHADFQKWEPSLGGKFPSETYNSIMVRLTNIINYLSLVSYTTQILPLAEFPNSQTSARHAWLRDLTVLLDQIEPTSHGITSTLTLLSASVTQGCGLPPYIQLPATYQLSRRLEQLDRGILSSKHIEEPGYSAYAVMQVASSLINDDLRRLVEDIRSLVGEVDFSFKVANVADESRSDKRARPATGKGKRE